ncbi:MAG TPA: hypothetical protein DCL78_04505 [Gammaproteobacteria bacterium]|nr:hypothetical protein [Pseudomonadales bacterium]MEC8810479.1 acyl-CoA thioesterase domain-containing protein [Pseudomonadota bacterium]HAG93358.1 hypothetical protein [Gammaproteobacteria bacterium]HAU16132.1 hypothetical protein [Gammaproteobacteria bacterium]|tara:strand:+ start:26910 stop:27791 length:882 start_codon:yes stop_codon:yes gene_type:complete
MGDSDGKHKHYCMDLHLGSKLINAERCLMQAPLTAEVQSRGRGARVGVLITMLDIAASDPVLTAWHPDWTATLDLSLFGIEILNKGPMVVDTHMLRRGRKIITVGADIYDGCGVDDFSSLQEMIEHQGTGCNDIRLVAKGLATFIRIPRTTDIDAIDYNPGKWVGQVRYRSGATQDHRYLNDRIGLRVIAPETGTVELDNSTYVANSIGTINGGVQAVAMEAAAELMHPHMTATDIQIHFISQVKTGPVRTHCVNIRATSDHCIVNVDLIEVGVHSRLIAKSTITLQSEGAIT